MTKRGVRHTINRYIKQERELPTKYKLKYARYRKRAVLEQRGIKKVKSDKVKSSEALL